MSVSTRPCGRSRVVLVHPHVTRLLAHWARNTRCNGGFGTGNPLDNINPNDIASIEVLKDAAAAAIYGPKTSGPT